MTTVDIEIAGHVSVVLSPTLRVINKSNGQISARLTECHGASLQLGTGLKVPYWLQKKSLCFFSIKYRFIIFLSMTFIEFVTLHSNLLSCWNGFQRRDMLTKAVMFLWLPCQLNDL